jgi:predicted amidohydrolase YtcJ
MFRLVGLVLLLSALLAGADADLILHNGKIVTVDSAFSIQAAVAIKSGKIVAVGSEAFVLKTERGPQTAVIDLKGRTVLPGLVDAHVHALEAALIEFRAPLPLLLSFAAVEAYIPRESGKNAEGRMDCGAANLSHAPQRDAHAHARAVRRGQ